MRLDNNYIMIHTVHFDDTYTDVRKLLTEIRLYKQGVRFESPVMEDVVYKEYVTGEEFRKRAVIKINTFCQEHGIL